MTTQRRVTMTTQQIERATLERVAKAEREADLRTSDPEAQPCQKAALLHFSPYRIGGGRRAPHWAHRWHVDRWFRSWQCEWEVVYGIVIDECMVAPRAWTKRGAVRKAWRWYRRGTDVGRSRSGRPRRLASMPEVGT